MLSVKVKIRVIRCMHDAATAYIFCQVLYYKKVYIYEGFQHMMFD